jgi:hypothetical protein
VIRGEGTIGYSGQFKDSKRHGHGIQFRFKEDLHNLENFNLPAFSQDGLLSN